jgi:hypothetical protein
MKELAECVGRNFAYRTNIRLSLGREDRFVLPKPEQLRKEADDIDKRVWEKEIDEYVKLKGKHTENCRKLFSLVLVQCTEYLKSKLEALSDYAGMKENFDVFNLIKSMKVITYIFEGNTYHLQALHDSKLQFYALRQGKDVTNVKFLEMFQTHVAVVENFCG